MSDGPLFAFLRSIAGRGLTQAEVDRFNGLLDDARVPITVTAQRPPPAAPQASAEVPFFDTIKAHLEHEEGRVGYAYQDNLGFWTIGVGRLIDHRKGGKLSDAEIDMLLANDIRGKMAAIAAWPAWAAVKDDPVRATALLSMAFQMGPAGLAGFHNSLQLIADKQWRDAAANLLQSEWARQTPNRAARVTRMIATGELQA